MAAERIRNRTRVAMLCYAMLWMDPVFCFFLEPIAISVSSIFSNCPISHCPPVQLVQPGQCRHGALSTISLAPSLPPFLTNLHFISFRFTFTSARKRGQQSSPCYLSISYRPIVDLLSYPWIRKTTRTRLGKNMVRHEDSLSLSLSPCVRPCK